MFVRVVLDTCAVRQHIHACSPSLNLDLMRRRRQDFRLSLSASAFVELTAQLAEKRIIYADWEARVPELDEVLDERWPCLPNGKQLAWLAGTQIVEPVNVEDESRHMRAYWHHLRTVSPDEFLRAKVVYRLSDGTLRGIQLNPKDLEDNLSAQRKDWIDYVKKMRDTLPTHGYRNRDEEEIYQLMMSDFGNDPGDAPGVAQKLDAVARMIARFLALALARKGAYNPESEGRKGDTFDLNLLFYLPLPAVVVTGDGRFVRGLRETAAPQAGHVLTIEEFNARLGDGTLASLVSAYRLPEEQDRDWRNAAYFRWERRGKKDGDDLADWFASEPVA